MFSISLFIIIFAVIPSGFRAVIWRTAKVARFGELIDVVIEAAGGVITDWSGEALSLNSDGRVIVAATPELHADMLRLL